MVLNSQHSLTASTTLASIVSAAVLTAVGLCVPYTERAAKNRAAPSARRGGESGARGSSSPARRGPEGSAQH